MCYAVISDYATTHRIQVGWCYFTQWIGVRAVGGVALSGYLTSRCHWCNLTDAVLGPVVSYDVVTLSISWQQSMKVLMVGVFETYHIDQVPIIMIYFIYVSLLLKRHPLMYRCKYL